MSGNRLMIHLINIVLHRLLCMSLFYWVEGVKAQSWQQVRKEETLE